MSRIVLVTGGGTGLGKAVATRFKAAGDAVIITGRDAGRLADTALEIGAQAVACDATDPGQVTRMAGEIGAQRGPGSCSGDSARDHTMKLCGAILASHPAGIGKH